MAELFNVVFAGEIAGRSDPAVVRANVGKLFNASEAVLDKLFSGQPVAVKKMVDRATAMKVRALMKQAGANTQLVQVDEQGRPLPGQAAPVPAPAAPAPASAPASAPAAAPVAGSMAARVQQLAAEQAAAAKAEAARAEAALAGVWQLAPVGSRLAPVAAPPPPAPDVSGISLAAPRSDLVRPGEIAAPPPVKVDISGLSMAPPNTEVLKDSERPRVAPVQVDISGISVAPVGAPLDEIREEKVLLNPDISGISLAGDGPG